MDLKELFREFYQTLKANISQAKPPFDTEELALLEKGADAVLNNTQEVKKILHLSNKLMHIEKVRKAASDLTKLENTHLAKIIAILRAYDNQPLFDGVEKVGVVLCPLVIGTDTIKECFINGIINENKLLALINIEYPSFQMPWEGKKRFLLPYMPTDGHFVLLDITTEQNKATHVSYIDSTEHLAECKIPDSEHTKGRTTAVSALKGKNASYATLFANSEQNGAPIELPGITLDEKNEQSKPSEPLLENACGYFVLRNIIKIMANRTDDIYTVMAKVIRGEYEAIFTAHIDMAELQKWRRDQVKQINIPDDAKVILGSLENVLSSGTIAENERKKLDSKLIGYYKALKKYLDESGVEPQLTQSFKTILQEVENENISLSFSKDSRERLDDTFQNIMRAIIEKQDQERFDASRKAEEAERKAAEEELDRAKQAIQEWAGKEQDLESKFAHNFMLDEHLKRILLESEQARTVKDLSDLRAQIRNYYTTSQERMGIILGQTNIQTDTSIDDAFSAIQNLFNKDTFLENLPKANENHRQAFAAMSDLLHKPRRVAPSIVKAAPTNLSGNPNGVSVAAVVDVSVGEAEYINLYPNKEHEQKWAKLIEERNTSDNKSYSEILNSGQSILQKSITDCEFTMEKQASSGRTAFLAKVNDKGLAKIRNTRGVDDEVQTLYCMIDQAVMNMLLAGVPLEKIRLRLTGSEEAINAAAQYAKEIYSIDKSKILCTKNFKMPTTTFKDYQQYASENNIEDIIKRLQKKSEKINLEEKRQVLTMAAESIEEKLHPFCSAAPSPRSSPGSR